MKNITFPLYEEALGKKDSKLNEELSVMHDMPMKALMQETESEDILRAEAARAELEMRKILAKYS